MALPNLKRLTGSDNYSWQYSRDAQLHAEPLSLAEQCPQRAPRLPSLGRAGRVVRPSASGASLAL
jgi:hypothetical protein